MANAYCNETRMGMTFVVFMAVEELKPDFIDKLPALPVRIEKVLLLLGDRGSLI